MKLEGSLVLEAQYIDAVGRIRHDRATEERYRGILQGAIQLPVEWKLISVRSHQGDKSLSLDECKGIELVAIVVAGAHAEGAGVAGKRAIHAVNADTA